MTKYQDNLILVGLPLYQGYIHNGTMMSVWDMVHEVTTHGYEVVLYYAKGPSLPIKRRQCVDKAREIGAKYLLMIDSDMVIPNPKYLWLMLSRKKKVISGVYYGKGEPWVAIMSRYRDPEYKADPTASIEQIMEVPYNLIFDLPKDAIIEVDGVGGGFILIETECFDGLREPYFLMTDLHGLGEDYWMCHRLKEKGYKIHVDTSIQLHHVGDYVFQERDHQLGKIMARIKFQKEREKVQELNGPVEVH